MLWLNCTDGNTLIEPDLLSWCSACLPACKNLFVSETCPALHYSVPRFLLCFSQRQRLFIHQTPFSPCSIVAGPMVYSSTFSQPPLHLDMARDLFCWWMIRGSDLHHFQVWPPCFFPDDDAQGRLESHMLKVEELPLISGYSNDESSLWTVTCARKGLLSCLRHCILCVYVSPQFSLLKLAHSPDILVILRLCLLPRMTSLKPTACVCIQLSKPAIWKKFGRERQGTAPAQLCHWHPNQWKLL